MTEKKKRTTLTFESVSEVCLQKKVVVTNFYKENSISYIDGICQCGNKLEKIRYVAIKNCKDDKYKCKECKKEYMSQKHRKSFDDVIKEFADKGCVVISDEKDYKNLKSKLKIIASCGHEYETNVMSLRQGKGLCRECSIKTYSGENAYNWNGGYDSEKIKFRKTYAFKQFVKEVYKRDGYKCQICGKGNCTLNAHHLDGYNWCEEKRTDVSNGITLCEDCHNDFHNTYGRGNNTKEQFFEFMDNNLKCEKIV